MTEWRDITEGFEVLEDQLVYVDAPLEGFLKRLDGALYAFVCTVIVPGCLWHWVLVPSESVSTSVASAFERARAVPPAMWGSIVEDRRHPEPRLTIAWLSTTEVPLPP